MDPSAIITASQGVSQVGQAARQVPFLGPAMAGLEGEMTNKLYGSPGDHAKDFMDTAYKGTSPWERLGSGGGGAGNVGSIEASQKRQLASQEKIAGLQAGASKYAAEKSAEATKYAADKSSGARKDTAIPINKIISGWESILGRFADETVGVGGGLKSLFGIEPFMDALKGKRSWLKGDVKSEPKHGPKSKKPVPKKDWRHGPFGH